MLARWTWVADQAETRSGWHHQGYKVDALDPSPTALDWGREHAAESGVEVSFVRANIFEWDPPDARYDLVFDSGCFHHLPPHRRISYRSLLETDPDARGRVRPLLLRGRCDGVGLTGREHLP